MAILGNRGSQPQSQIYTIAMPDDSENRDLGMAWAGAWIAAACQGVTALRPRWSGRPGRLARALGAGLGGAFVGFVLLKTLAPRLAELSPARQALAGLIPLHLAALGAVVMALADAPGGPARALRLEPPGPRLHGWLRLALGRLLWVYPATLGLSVFMILLYKWFHWTLPGNPILTMLHDESSPIWMIPVCAAIMIWAPLAEEILFRTVLTDGLRSVLPVRVAVLGSALLFAGAHGLPAQLPALLLLALVLQQLRTATGSLWPAVFLHSAYNSTSLALLLVAEAAGIPTG